MGTKNIKIFAIVGLVILLVVGLIFFWQAQNKKQSNQVVDTFYQSITSLEIADTPEKQEIGLMNRTTLCNTCAMLFVFEHEDIQSFWMKNTLISLDIIFISSDGTINTIFTNTIPKQLYPTYNSKEKSQYVLEVNANFVKKINLNEGIKLDLQRLRS